MVTWLLLDQFSPERNSLLEFNFKWGFNCIELVFSLVSSDSPMSMIIFKCLQIIRLILLKFKFMSLPSPRLCFECICCCNLYFTFTYYYRYHIGADGKVQKNSNEPRITLNQNVDEKYGWQNSQWVTARFLCHSFNNTLKNSIKNLYMYYCKLYFQLFNLVPMFVLVFFIRWVHENFLRWDFK